MSGECAFEELNNPKISIIIPVYNVGLYLTRCLESVVNQSYKHLEIIVINDGSTDDSLAIIQGFMAVDSRIKLVNKKNEGLVAARKSGLELATGTYVHHLDGDDFLELNAYEKLIRKAVETDADLLLFDFWFDHEQTKNKIRSVAHTSTSYTAINYLQQIFFNGGYFAVWAYLHKRSLYENKIHFSTEIASGEDAYLTTQLAYYSQRIDVLDSEPLLHYCIRPNSITTSTISFKRISDLLKYPDLICHFLQDKKEYPDLKKALASLKIQSFNDVVYVGYLKEIVRMSREAMQLYRQYPELRHYRTNKAFYKLYYAYGLNPVIGYLYSLYYKKKKKIKNNRIDTDTVAVI